MACVILAALLALATEAEGAALKNGLQTAAGGPCFVSAYPEAGDRSEIDRQFIALAPDYNERHIKGNRYASDLVWGVKLKCAHMP